MNERFFDAIQNLRPQISEIPGRDAGRLFIRYDMTSQQQISMRYRNDDSYFYIGFHFYLRNVPKLSENDQRFLAQNVKDHILQEAKDKISLEGWLEYSCLPHNQDSEHKFVYGKPDYDSHNNIDLFDTSDRPSMHFGLTPFFHHGHEIYKNISDPKRTINNLATYYLNAYDVFNAVASKLEKNNDSIVGILNENASLEQQFALSKKELSDSLFR